MAISKEELESRLADKRLKKWNETHKLIDEIDHKLCSVCDMYFPSSVEFFYKSKLNVVDGLNPYCIECSKKKAFQWIENNRERFRENMNKYSKKPERKQATRIRSEEQRLKGKQKDWQQNNPEKLTEYRRKYSNKKHKISDTEWDNCRMYFNFKCAYCDKTWEQNKKETRKDLHREHVDSNGLDNLSNCVPACNSCNSQKHDFEFDYWFNENNPIYTIVRKDKILKWINEDHLKYIE